MKQKLLLLISLTLLICINTNAQTTTSKIKGIITDNTGEPLFGATVIAKHTPTGTVSGTTAQDNGRYTLSNLRIGGPYTITTSYLGFKSNVITNVFLTLGKTTNINVVLSEDSNTLEEIVISSSKNTVFNNDRTGAQTSIGSKDLKTLPTISRSASDFTRLDPAASGGSFGGKNDQFNNFTLDGSIFNNPFGLDAATPGGQTASQPVSLDAIEQISVSLAPYDVTLSGFTGASVNAVTKSGTNTVTGTVYSYYRNQDFTGGKIKGEDIFVPKLTQSQIGASIGAPIIKDKLFVFVNFEKDNRTDLGQSWLPNTGSGAINESRVSVSDLEEVRTALAGIGYNTGAYEGFTHKSNSTKGLFKLDWNINKDNRISFVYNFLNASRDLPAHPTALGFRGPSSQMLQFENTGYQINNNLNSFLLELNSTVTDNITNKFQAGYTHFDDFRKSKSAPMPAFRIQDGNGSNYIIAGHEPFSINNTLDQKVFQITNNLNISTGDHNYTIGFSFEKFEFDNSFNLGAYGFGDSRGYVGAFGGDFASMDAFRTGISNGLLADAFANAQNVFDNNNNNDSWALAETNVGQFAFYVQDDWNVNDNFKLSYGVRFDKPLFFDSAQKAQDVIDKSFYLPNNPYTDPSTGETVLFDSTKMPNNNFLISPRIGFNWDVNGDSTLQLRGGSGLFTGRFPFVWLGNQIANPNVYFYQVVDPDFKFPQVWRTSFGADIKLKDGTVLTTDLSYTKDINGAHVQNWGLKTPTGTLAGGVDNRLVYTDSDRSPNWGGPNDTSNAYVFTNSNKGRTLNASLKAQKTFDNGLYLMGAYNFLNSKDVNSIEAEITGDAFAFNPILSNANDATLAHSKYGDTHRFIAVASKSWNYGSNDKWTTTISSFYELAKGGRFNYTYAGDLNNDGSNLNDLIYIPTDSEVDVMTFKAPTSAGDLSIADQKEGLRNYINQDDYLSDRKGQYAERYGALAPWRGKMDVKFIQNLKLGNNNSIEFTVDILNFGNLLNSNWGLVQQPDAVQLLGVNVDNTGLPIYSFNSELKETFVYNSSLISRWQAQVGLRYSF
ncbi:carboxypeptidase regulatory-like domain-containing protein [Polaribacter sp. PL03]|uniref:TonB-dependent receptor n=1 Tax=Polaribacter sp. PL03 TaxID=3088353 RepID=UPI0029D33B1E|nr:carboxypeptidase regulatory-like domain-containing protein [Polaribacter sp. PL03]MDX6746025.1 carboxypeptidase regulatory-like domain-containing protein [Polaribacter sp. PL03]